MSKFIDRNETSGLETWGDSTYGDNRQQFHYRQDVEPLLDLAKRERNDGLTDKGIKKDLWLYARIPPVTILEIKHKYGVDCFKRDHLKRFFSIINQHYPHLKTTEKHHELKN
jgi:hypothetical protein